MINKTVHKAQVNDNKMPKPEALYICILYTAKTLVNLLTIQFIFIWFIIQIGDVRQKALLSLKHLYEVEDFLPHLESLTERCKVIITLI